MGAAGAIHHRSVKVEATVDWELGKNAELIEAISMGPHKVHTATTEIGLAHSHSGRSPQAEVGPIAPVGPTVLVTCPHGAAGAAHAVGLLRTRTWGIA
jgi:hypothetical protein